MCGIIAIVRRPAKRPVPAAADILAAFSDLEVEWNDAANINALAGRLEEANDLLMGAPGVTALIRTPGLASEVRHLLAPLGTDLDRIDREADSVVAGRTEALNRAMLRLKDAAWAIEKDRLRTAEAVLDLTGPKPSDAAIDGMLSVQQALSAIDRLEVRGRDSAGLHLYVFDHGVDLAAAPTARAIEERAADPLFRTSSVRAIDDKVSFVYKAAAEIGELGDNVAALRAAIRSDELLASLLAQPEARVAVLGHTRWASVGIISEANAHPINSEQDGRDGQPYFVGALNGDVDNHADLKADADLCILPSISTDAKVIPTLVSTHAEAGLDATAAFQRAVSSFEGSVAIAVAGADEPGRLQLALKGSGQALYVGLAEDCYIVASEPYGVVELTDRYLRLDGETPADLDNPESSRGQIVVLDAERAGEVAGLRRLSYDGTELPVAGDDLTVASITTRDIDRAGYPHYLLKEITESSQSFRKTLRGKLIERDGTLTVEVGETTIPAAVAAGLSSGAYSRVIGIGQGTASVAASAFIEALRSQVDLRKVQVEHLLATELSAFHLTRDMSDALVVAVSQSGTTTDTNRTVDLVRSRGGTVLAIVNRRGSDLTDKADGVLYTSDGRDVEMSVASTKAFYSQVAAGFLLASAIADLVGRFGPEERSQRILRGLQRVPDAMDELLSRRDRIAAVAQRVAPSRRYWAIVGNGPNRIAAEEVRIKLSELCYKAIACDATEDKKHIDLSSEPLIFVCASGLEGSTAGDVAKEIAIYRAHKATPVVVATEGDSRFSDAPDLIAVPAVEPELGFVMSTMAGHLFGYEAALAIDGLAGPLRVMRSEIEQAIAANPSGYGSTMLAALRPAIETGTNAFFSALRDGQYNGHVEASSATRLAMMLRYAMGVIPLDTYQLDFGKVGTPAVVIDDLMLALSQGIDELTRPVDAIKHQAKTVTVGISRTDETLLQIGLVNEVISAGAPRDSLSYETLRTLAALNIAVEEINGYVRYRVEGDPTTDDARISVVDRSGIGAEIPSRVDRDPVLRGTKHRVALDRRVLVTQGRNDGRSIIIIPEVKDAQTTGLTLLHTRFADDLDGRVARSVLMGYQNRYTQIRDAVLETESSFNDDRLAQVPVVDLLVQPPSALADRLT